MATLEEFKTDLSLLIETGLIAIKQGDEESAKRIFNAVGIIDPQNTAKKMGLGLIALHKMEIKNALKCFEEIINVEPTNYRAKSFQAMGLVLSAFQDGFSMDEKQKNLQKAALIAEDVCNNSKEETTKQLAQSILNWEKELQTNPDAFKNLKKK